MPEPEKSWGLKFNPSPSYERLKRDQRPQGSPEWLNPHQISLWQEQGLVVWNSTEKRLERLSGREALDLLEKLVSKDSWKADGISITRQVHRIQIPVPSRGRRKKTEPEATAGASETKTERAYEEIIHLPLEAGSELLDLLQQNTQRLTKMAEQEKKRRDEAFRQVFDLLFKSHREKEETGFNFKARAFEWECRSEGHWISHHQQVEGSVQSDKSPIFWSAQAQYRGSVGKFNHFVDLQQAVDWVEKEMVDLASQPPPEPEPYCLPDDQWEAARVRLRQQLISDPFWIETAALEQAQKIWNQSTILRQFKDKKISRARYGYQEVETGFTVFLGACEDPANPWGRMSTRQEYLDDRALRGSICYSLDVNGFRDYLGLTVRASSDEDTLRSMHEDRARSKYLPAEVRLESRVWLAQQEPIER